MSGNIVIGGLILFVFILIVWAVQMKKEKETLQIKKIERFKEKLDFLFETFKNKKTFLKDIEIVEIIRHININQYDIFFKYKNVYSTIRYLDFKEQIKSENAYYIITEFEKKIEDIDKRIEKCKEFVF